MQGLVWGRHLPLDEAERKRIISLLAAGCLGSFWAHAKARLGEQEPLEPLHGVKREEIWFPPYLWRKHSPWSCPDLPSPTCAMLGFRRGQNLMRGFPCTQAEWITFHCIEDSLEVLNRIRVTVPFTLRTKSWCLPKRRGGRRKKKIKEGSGFQG